MTKTTKELIAELKVLHKKLIKLEKKLAVSKCLEETLK